MNECQKCGSDTRMQVNVVISAPGDLAHNLSKRNLRSKDVFIMGVKWETADFICTNAKCRHVTIGYGNYVSNLEKEKDKLFQQLKNLTIQCEKVVKWKHLMSYNDSYLGEPNGDLKRAIYDIDRVMSAK